MRITYQSGWNGRGLSPGSTGDIRFFFAKEAKVMELQVAMKIIRALHQGRSPETEVPLPEGSICLQSDVRQAFAVALDRLAWSVNEKLREDSLPPNSGKPWTADEDTQLSAEFDQSLSLREIGIMHGRTRFAIQKRLEHLGKMPASEPGAVRAA